MQQYFLYTYVVRNMTRITVFHQCFLQLKKKNNYEMILTLQLIRNILKFTYIPKTLFSDFSVVTLIKNTSIQNFLNTSPRCHRNQMNILHSFHLHWSFKFCSNCMGTSQYWPRLTTKHSRYFSLRNSRKNLRFHVSFLDVLCFRF
jgi:hypothetical protein